MNFMKKVFDGQVDNAVHLQFQKFSRGKFKDKALIKVKQSGGKITVNTSAEFANELVEEVAKKLGGNNAKVTGVIVSTLELNINFKDKKQFQGVKRYIIDKEMSGNEIISLLERYPKAFFALSFSLNNTQLKIKPKAPKSAKPSTKSGEIKADFCKLITNDKNLTGDFVFEKPNFKNAEINHNFIIEDIIIPEELKNGKDFGKIREEAKRRGKVIREAVIDGQRFKSEKDFEV